jgi:hypothetical protein
LSSSMTPMTISNKRHSRHAINSTQQRKKVQKQLVYSIR